MTGEDLYAELRRSGEHVGVFNEIAKALTSTLEPHEVYAVIMKQITGVVSPTSWSLILLDEATDQLVFEIVVGNGAEKLKGQRLATTEGVAGKAFTTGELQIVGDVGGHEAHASRFDAMSGFETKNVIALPLRARDRSLGVLELVNALDPKFRREDMLVLRAIADYAAIAITNARNFQRVQELTTIDEHTGLYNTRHLREVLQNEVNRATRFQHPISLIFLDLDRFKEVNDSHGHLVGSALLREVGVILQNLIRRTDSAYRYGGDEFALLLIETDVEGAHLVASRVLEKVNNTKFFEARGLSVSVGVSLGVATFPKHGRTDTEILHAADQAMYRAKGAGRGRVVIAEEPKK